MKRLMILSVPVLVIGGYTAAVLTPEFVARTRAAFGAAAETLTTPPEPEPMSAEQAFALLNDQERTKLEVLRMERERDQAIEDLAHQLVVNRSLEEQLRVAEATRDAFKSLSEEVIGFGLSRPPLMLRPTPPEEPSEEDTEKATSPVPRAIAGPTPS